MTAALGQRQCPAAAVSALRQSKSRSRRLDHVIDGQCRQAVLRLGVVMRARIESESFRGAMIIIKLPAGQCSGAELRLPPPPPRAASPGWAVGVVALDRLPTAGCLHDVHCSGFGA